MELQQEPEGEPPPQRTPIATQILAVVLLLAMVALTFTTERTDKAWTSIVKQLGLDQIDLIDQDEPDEDQAD